MLNPFFLQGSKSEQSLIQSLVNEQLRMYGVEVYYLPRKYVTERKVIKEVIESKFDNAYPIEAYVDTYEGYEGQGTILSKFGVQPLNDLNLIISKERFETYISPLIKNLPDIKLSTRPKEGDLIWFPLGDRLFEIKFVEHEKPFYQLQKTYVYELRCELFRYEDEILDTGVGEIDDNVSKEGYIQTLTMVGLGVTATATVTGICTTGGVRFVTISNRGNGYTSRPKISFSAAPVGGTTAVGIATLIGGLIDCNGLKEDYKIQGVELINPGCGYTVPPSVIAVGGGGAGFAATTTIGNGIISQISITNGGSGYVMPPTVTFSGPGTGVTATGSAYINSSGIVTAIYITNSGLGYTESPTITISSPYTSGSGSYEYNETVTGSISGTTAVVKKWDSTTNQLEVSNISGSFVNGDVLVGSISGSSYEIRLINTDNIVDPFADNDNIELEADAIIDFSEINPFGTP